MNKCILLILISLCLISCWKKDEQYYLSNPLALQEALKNCPRQTGDLSCQTLEALNNRLAELARELQMNPQAFGHKIIKLQNTIISQEEDIRRGDASLKTSLASNKKQLEDMISIVRLFESPGG